MMNEKTREMLMDEVIEWMGENAEFTKEFLGAHGYDWCQLYTLGELFDDYCGSDLVEIIQLFQNSNCDATDYDAYFVDDNGDLRDGYDLDSEVEDFVYNNSDGIFRKVLDDLECGLIDNDELIAIYEKYAVTPWEDVARKLWERRDDVTLHYVDEIDKVLMNGDKSTDDFINICDIVHDMVAMVNVLTDTRFFGIDESEYGELCELFYKTDDITCNEVYNMLNIVRSWACGGVTIEKATEMYVKNWR